MRFRRLACFAFTLCLPLSASSLVAQGAAKPAAPPEPASFERVGEQLSQDRIDGAVRELLALAVQAYPALPEPDASDREILRRALETGRGRLRDESRNATERRLSRQLVCLARAYFPHELPAVPGAVGEPLRVGKEVSRPELIGQMKPQYTLEARKNRTTGVVIVESIIDQEGCVRKVEVLKGLPDGLNEAAVAAVRNWTFQPAAFEGKPVKVYYVLTINFQVDDKKNEGAGTRTP